MKKVAKMLAAIGLTGVALCNMTGCTSLWDIIGNSIDDYFKDRPPLIEPFEDRCVTTEDGFTYYEQYNDKTEQFELCLLGGPEVEELTIPEYIDGVKVGHLGYRYASFGGREDYCLVGNGVKKLIIKYPVDMHKVAFPDVETVVYYDYLYTSLCSEFYDSLTGVLGVCSWGTRENPGKIELRRTDRELETVKEHLSKITEIKLPSTVTVIESGVFDGIDNAVIKTSYESKPDGWEEGWNGNCPVEWGQNILILIGVY